MNHHIAPINIQETWPFLINAFCEVVDVVMGTDVKGTTIASLFRRHQEGIENVVLPTNEAIR